jgi:hypothetical protein
MVKNLRCITYATVVLLIGGHVKRNGKWKRKEIFTWTKSVSN